MPVLSALIVSSAILTNTVQLAAALNSAKDGVPFEIEGTVTFPSSPCVSIFALDDPAGSASFEFLPKMRIDSRCTVGDTVRICGFTEMLKCGRGIARGRSIQRIKPGRSKPVPIPVDIPQIRSGTVDNKVVSVHGTVREVFRDEIDPSFNFVILSHQGDTFYSAFPGRHADLSRLSDLTDAEVSITGLCVASDTSVRAQVGHYVFAQDFDAITIIRNPPADPFDVPSISKLPADPLVIATLPRRRITGWVIAIWETNHILVLDDNELLHDVECRGKDVPPHGSRIDAVGLPKTDLYRINLSNAIWRPAGGTAYRDPPVTPISVRSLLTNDRGERKINSTSHGKLLSLRGKVINLTEGNATIMTLKDETFSVPVDISAAKGLGCVPPIGSDVRITGRSIVKTEDWHPSSSFPHTTGILLTIHSPDDITVVSYPPWWTPDRLLIVIGSLVAALLGIIIWNLILRQISRSRIDERTRLSVELHDSLSQNLSGLACQITAVKKALPDATSTAALRLDIAERMLFSSRTELKRCLWDLRGNTLECRNTSEAIRKTVEPILGDARLAIRFNVPRARLNDSEAHAILCIVRELASNAMQHGHASAIRIAGALDADAIVFSVRDNGCGFDVANRAGGGEGHFGIDGIQERVDRLNGTFDMTSSPGSGTAVRIRMPLHSARRNRSS